MGLVLLLGRLHLAGPALKRNCLLPMLERDGYHCSAFTFVHLCLMESELMNRAAVKIESTNE